MLDDTSRVCPVCGKEKPERELWQYARRCRACVADAGRAMRRTSLTYHDWALHRGADPTSPYVEYRCDKCGRRNTGQVVCEPRNWFRVPDEYDPTANAAGSASRRIRYVVPVTPGRAQGTTLPELRTRRGYPQCHRRYGGGALSASNGSGITRSGNQVRSGAGAPGVRSSATSPCRACGHARRASESVHQEQPR